VTREFDAHLRRLSVPHTYTELPGIGHNPMAVPDALGEENWEFYRAVFGAGDSADNRKDESIAQQHAQEDVDKPSR
jgi:hypothetical protein